MNLKKLETITLWPEPTTAKQVQSFLSFTNFYRHFIHSYSRITLPLTELTRKSAPFQFSDIACDAFNKLKAAFTSYPVLRHYAPVHSCH
jgi:hypothetical protein